MRKKNGFTLIELLATIVIVGIVLSIGTAGVINYVTNSRTKAKALSEKNILASAVTYATEYYTKNNWVKDESKEEKLVYSCVSIDQLKSKGFLKNKLDESTIKFIKLTKDIDSQTILKKESVNVEDQICKQTVLQIPKHDSNETYTSVIIVKYNITSNTNYNNPTGTCNNISSSSSVAAIISENEAICKFEGMKDNTSYKITLTLEYNNNNNNNIAITSKQKTIKTKMLKKPIISKEGTNTLTVLYDNTGIYEGLANHNISSEKANPQKIEGQNIITYGQSFNDSIIRVFYDKTAKLIAKIGDGTNEEVSSQDITIDNTIPNILISAEDTNGNLVASNTWINKNLKVDITSETSGAEVYYCTKNGKSDCTNFGKYGGTLNFSADGTTKIRAYAIGNNGKSSDIIDYIVKIDKVAPVLTVGLYKNNTGASVDKPSEYTYTSGTWYSGRVYTEISKVTDIGGSGISQVKYVTSGQTTEETKYNDYGRNINAEGESTIYYEATDNAGNKTISATYTIKLDRTAPSLTVKVYKKTNGTNITEPGSLNEYSNNTWYSGYTLSYATATDTGGSGVAGYSYTSTGASTGTSTNRYRNIDTEGTTNITYSATDNAGNKATAGTKTVKLDRTPPEISFDNFQYPSSKSYSYNTTFSDPKGTDINAVSGIEGSESLYFSCYVNGPTTATSCNSYTEVTTSPNLYMKLKNETTPKYIDADGDDNGTGTHSYSYTNDTVHAFWRFCDKANNCVCTRYFITLNTSFTSSSFTEKNLMNNCKAWN